MAPILAVACELQHLSNEQHVFTFVHPGRASHAALSASTYWRHREESVLAKAELKIEQRPPLPACTEARGPAIVGYTLHVSLVGGTKPNQESFSPPDGPVRQVWKDIRRHEGTIHRALEGLQQRHRGAGGDRRAQMSRKERGIGIFGVLLPESAPHLLTEYLATPYAPRRPHSRPQLWD